MAKVLRNFLIGVGLDTTNYDKGAENVENSLGRMRSLSTIAGSAIAGAFASVGLSAITAGNRVDELNLQFERFRTSPQFINDYGNAVEAMGGQYQDAVKAIATAEDALNKLRIGEYAAFQQAALIGVRDELMALERAADGGGFLMQLADIIPKMNNEQQALLQDSLGLSDGVMRSLRGGSVELSAAIDRAGQLYGDFGRATEAAREYSRALAELNTRFEGIGETMAEKLLPSFTNILDGFGGFIDKHRNLIDEGVDVVAENPVASSLVAGGAAAAATGVGLKAMPWFRGLGKLLTRASVPTMAVGVGAYLWDKKPEDIERLTGYKPSEYIFENTPVDAFNDAKEWVSKRWSGRDEQKEVVEPKEEVKYSSEIPSLPPALRDAEPTDRSVKTQESIVEPVVNVDTPDLVSDNRINVSQPDINVAAPEPVVNVDLPESIINVLVNANELPQPVNYQPALTPEPDLYPKEDDSQYGVPPLPDALASQYVDEKKEQSNVLPVYFGGEVSNEEAASVNPEVIMIQQQNESKESRPQQQRLQVQNNLEVRMELDGRVLDTKITDVIERREKESIYDFTGAVDR